MSSDSSTNFELVELTQTQTQTQRTESEPPVQRQLTEQDIEIINRDIIQQQNQRIRGEGIDPTIPWNRATMSWEYRKCGRHGCRCRFGRDYRHGPYLVMIWKDLDSEYLNKVKKKYLGKSKDFDVDKVLDDWGHKMTCKRMGLIDREYTASKLRKAEAILNAAASGNNKLAQEYELKLKNNKVSVDWAYKRVRNEIEKEVI